MTGPARTATVLSHARPAQTAEALRALIEAAEREGVLLRFDAEETRKYGLKPRDGLVLDAPLSDDVELCVSLGGDGTILRAPAPLRRDERAGLRGQLRRGRLPGHHRPRRRRSGGRVRPRAVRRLRGADAARARLGDARGPAGGDQRRRDPPPRRRARGRARLRDRRGGGGVGALRRPRALHSGGLDGLQPGQRRPGAGVGRGGLRRLVHRAALADRQGARGGAERPALGPQPLAGRGRHLAGRAARPECSGPGTRSRPRSCARRRTWRRCRGPRSTGGCARNSADSPHDHDCHRRRPRADRPAAGCPAQRARRRRARAHPQSRPRGRRARHRRAADPRGPRGARRRVRARRRAPTRSSSPPAPGPAAGPSASAPSTSAPRSSCSTVRAARASGAI